MAERSRKSIVINISRDLVNTLNADGDTDEDSSPKLYVGDREEGEGVAGKG